MRTNKLFMLFATLLIVSCSSEELLNTDFSKELTQIQKEQKKGTQVNAAERNDEGDAFEKNDTCDPKPGEINKFKNALALCKYENSTIDGDQNASSYCNNGSFNAYNNDWVVFQSSGSTNGRSEVKVAESFSIDDEQKMTLEMIIQNAPYDDRGTDSKNDDRGLTVAQIHNRHNDVDRPLLRIAAIGDELRYIIAHNIDGSDNTQGKMLDFKDGNRFYIQLRFTGDGKTFTIYATNKTSGGDTFDEHFTTNQGDIDWDSNSLDDHYYFKTGAYAQTSSGSGDKPRVSLSKFQLDLEYNGSSSSGSDSGSSGSIVMMRKKNATGYALDGGGNNNNIHQWTYSQSNDNQKWVEIDRGSGYYSYQRLNTSYCIDGSNNGSNGNNVKIYACQENNQNQHWKKIDMGGGYYRLEKRNASNYSIDGNQKTVNGRTVYGGNGINVHMWSNDNSNENQQWKFEYQ